ncbi:MAG: N-acetylmuramidase family protein [Planctomycetota bacterium]
MAGYRLPGPLCGEPQPWSLLDGTLALWRFPSPGPVCVASSIFRASAPLAVDPGSDVSFLFNSCLNPATGIGEEAYEAAAKRLGVDVATIKAVADVETSGAAFDALGRPRILFERHYFHRLTSGRFDLTHSRVSAKSAGGYGKFSAQYGKLEEAYALDADAALRSASWGRFQIMGNNFIAAGFSSSPEFVKAMARSEEEHLRAFVSFVRNGSSMAEALRRQNWAAFAKAYNGPGYAKNQYDTKLAAAYARFAAAAPAANAAKATARPAPGRK